MTKTTQPNTTELTDAASSGVRAWVVYGSGLAFIVLLFVCYVQADIVLKWVEAIVHALFL